MTDPLSVAASISGLISLADVVFSRIFKYARAVKNAKSEIAFLAEKTQRLSGVLHSLLLLAKELDTGDAQYRFRLHNLIACGNALQKIENTLDARDPAAKDRDSDDSQRGSHSQSLNSSEHDLKKFRQLLDGNKTVAKARNFGSSVKFQLTWPFSSSETKEMIKEISEHQNTISTAMYADSLADLLKSLSVQTQIRESVGRIEQAMTLESLTKKQQEAITFFRVEKPNSKHDQSLKDRHSCTGQWLIEDEKFKNWMTTPSSKLWLSGIPGAGKTVLASVVIEECRKRRSPESAVAFFYCDFSKKDTQDPSKILGTLASQIAGQDRTQEGFKLLGTYHGECKSFDRGSENPDAQALLELIQEMSASFEEVSIIVDGIDECESNTVKVLEFLIQLNAAASSNIRTLFISRDEQEIKIRLEKSYDHIVIAAQSPDVRSYVEASIERLTHERKLRVKAKGLKEEIIERLVDGAKGMFRWVACQLDYLCELPHDAARRQALQNLPPGLDETYERILEQVNKRDPATQNLVHNTLRWLLYEPRITTAALCEALSIEDGITQLDPDSRPDEEDVLIFCSSLVRKTVDGEQIEISHYTVKEFLHLEQSRWKPELAQYRLDPKRETVKLATQRLLYLNMKDFNSGLARSPDELKDRQVQHPFRILALEFPELPSEDWDDKALFEAAKSLFDPDKRLNLLAWAQEVAVGECASLQNNRTAIVPIPLGKEDDLRNFVDRTTAIRSSSPLHFAAMLGVPQIVNWLLKKGSELDRVSAFGTPVHCALLGKDSFVYRYPHTIVPFRKSAKMTLDCLLAAGADCAIPVPANIPGKGVSTMFLAMSFSYESADEAKMLIPDILSSIGNSGGHLQQEDIHALENWKEKSSRMVSVRKEPTHYVETTVLALRERWVPDAARNQFIDLTASCRPDSDKQVILRNPDRLYTLPSKVVLRERLAQAAMADKPEEMRLLLQQPRIEIDAVDGLGQTALHKAALHESLNVLEILLSAGANVRKTDFEGRTALHHCASNYDGQGSTLILQHGANPGAIDNKGCSLWDLAAEKDNVDVLKAFLSLEENPKSSFTSKSHMGLSALYWAMKAQALNALLFLMQHTQGWATDYKFALAFWTTVDNDQTAGLSKALHRHLGKFSDTILSTAEVGFRAMSSAITKNDKGLVEEFLAKGIRVHDLEAGIRSKYFTPLESACRKHCELSLFEFLVSSVPSSELARTNPEGNGLLHLLCSSESRSTANQLKCLLQKGVDVNMLDGKGRSALIVSAMSSKPQHIAFLLQHDANLEIQTKHGWNFLHNVALNRSDACFESVLDCRMSKNAWKATCTIELFVNYEVSTLLKDFTRFSAESGVSFEVADCSLLHLSTGFPRMLQYVLDRGLMDVDFRAENDFTPLHQAAFANHVESTKILLSRGADIDARTKSGATPLHFAVGFPELLQHLIGCGADVGVADKYGNLPIHMAASRGMDGSVFALLEHSPLQAQNHLGMTPELSALSGGFASTAELLKVANEKRGYESSTTSTSSLLRTAALSRALLPAIAKGEEKIVTNLIDAGADVDHTPVHDGVCGCTPFVHAFEKRSPTIASLLINRGATLSFETCQEAEFPGLTAVHLASKSPDFDEVLKLLLSKSHVPSGYGIHSTLQPLHIAVESGNMAGLKVLLEHYSNQPIDSEKRCLDANQHGLGSDQSASTGAESRVRVKALGLAVSVDDLDATKLLMDYDPDVKARLANSYLLHNAISEGSSDMVKLLLEKGAPPNQHNPQVDTPACIALRQGSLEIFHLLEKFGANCKLQNWKDRRIKKYRVMEFVSVEGKASHKRATIIALVAEKYSPVGRRSPFHTWNNTIGRESATEELWRSTLHSTPIPLQDLADELEFWEFDPLIQNESLSLIKRVLKYESKHPGAGKEFGPFHHYSKISQLCQASLLGKVELLELLIEYGADIDAEGCPDGTALMAACGTGRLDSAEFLVRRGAKLCYVKDNHFRSAFLAAEKYPKICKWLLIERHTQQFKIEDVQADGLNGDSKPSRPWAGLQEVKIPWKGRFQRYHEESSFAHFLRLRDLRKGLLGKRIQWTEGAPNLFVALGDYDDAMFGNNDTILHNHSNGDGSNDYSDTLKRLDRRSRRLQGRIPDHSDRSDVSDSDSDSDSDSGSDSDSDSDSYSDYYF